MNHTAPEQQPYLVWIILLLLVPALFINLGVSPLITDEATRGVVAFEMKQSGNLITPTINGEYYFNKPPLYNWILLGFFNLFHQYSELVLRLPALISLLIFGWIIYATTRREMGSRVGFISALLFITCGRILFYDSMRGLIDLSFSMVIFLNFYLIYLFLKRRQYFSLYVVSYFLTSAAFLMKGLPALVFQALTLLAALAYFKSLKKLFHPSHLAGLAIFILLVGGYYYLLWQDSREPEFFARLVSQSTTRTFIKHSFWNTVQYVFLFPFEQVYHLLPWSILFIFLFTKSFYRRLRENSYQGYLALVFAVNIPVYWTSLGSHPRYIFMLYPILFILLADYYYQLKQQDKFYRAFWNIMFISLGLALIVGSWFFFSNRVSGSGRAIIIYSISMAAVLTGYFFMWRKRNTRLEWMMIILLSLRTFFDLIVLPDREANVPQAQEIQAVEKIDEITRDNELLLHPAAPVTHEFIFYMSTARNEILRKEYGDIRNGVYYIFPDMDPLREGEHKILDFESSLDKQKSRLSILTKDSDPQ
jgi:4-amino-4-deoxy-L-arabinose transferase-like glycosyltransferase